MPPKPLNHSRRAGLITNLEVENLALYYYKSAEIARIFASLKGQADQEKSAL
jgi:hypothetical protein